MTKRQRWTAEEDKILVQAIKANPHNKAKVFREVSEKLGRNAKCCANRWYNILSNPKHKAYAGCMFTMVGASSLLNNRSRENARIAPKKIRKSIWSRIKAILHL